MRSKFAVSFVGSLLTAAMWAQSVPIDPQNTLHINLQDDAPIGVMSANWGNSTATARGGALLLDLHTSLVLKNSSNRHIRGITLLVKSQEVTPGGKGSVSVASLNVAPGETFPVRMDLQLLRPVQSGGGPMVQVSLDGVLFDDLSFYGPNQLNSRRSMTVWELEGRRDRKYFRQILETAGQEKLREAMVSSLNRQAERNTMDARISQSGRSTNVMAGRQLQFAFLDTPNAPVELGMGRVTVNNDEARTPRMLVENRSDRGIRGMEVGWLVRDSRGKQYVAGSIPLDVTLGAHQSTTVVQDADFKVSDANGRPIAITELTGFLTSVEYLDGRMWVPEGASRTPNPSPEEQRLAEMYKRKGLNAVMDELRKF
jgi:hypothetical protein